MNNEQWNILDENDFDSVLKNSLPDLPPESIAQSVTPWKKAMRRVFIGIGLSSLTLNFSFISLIQPFVGAIFCLLGFRSLKEENKWFKACFIITLIRTAIIIPALIFNTTSIYYDLESTVGTISSISGLSSLFLVYVFFCLALREVQKKTALKPKIGASVSLIIWYGILCFLGFINYNGLVVPTVMIICFILILINLYKISEQLSNIGYAIDTAKAVFPDKAIVIPLIAVLLVGCFYGYFFANSYPMQWKEIQQNEHEDVLQLKDELLNLDFPKEILDDLSKEDILSCSGASRIVQDISVMEIAGEDLKITGIAVEIPGENQTWVVFHHFLWLETPIFYGTESLQLWPVYKNKEDHYQADGDVTGRLLYNKDGQRFTSPYHSIENETFTTESVFGRDTNSDTFATFSLPSSGKSCRGYITYKAKNFNEDYLFDSWINYTHQKSFLQYPAVTAKEMRMTTPWNDAGAFYTFQDALQFRPSEIF